MASIDQVYIINIYYVSYYATEIPFGYQPHQICQTRLFKVDVRIQAYHADLFVQLNCWLSVQAVYVSQGYGISFESLYGILLNNTACNPKKLDANLSLGN